MIINEKAKKLIPINNFNNLYVVADFDRTLTNGKSKTSWSILAGSDLVPKSYIEERQVLYDYYRPIEIDETINFNERSMLVKEWFKKHIELFVKYQITEEIFNTAAIDLNVMEFRKGAKDFLAFLYENSIPLIIISAGIGNFIEAFLDYNNCYYDNIYVSSNKVIFKDGIAVDVADNIIHSLNKNEVSLPFDILEKLKDKNRVLLLGDQVSDLNMVKTEENKEVLSIGFLSDDLYLETMSSNFDIVCEKDDDYNSLRKILF